MSNSIAPEDKWVLYRTGYGVTAAVCGLYDTAEEVINYPGIYEIEWIDQGGRYLGLPGGSRGAGFYYTLNQDGETIYNALLGLTIPTRRKSFGERLYDWLCRSWVK